MAGEQDLDKLLKTLSTKLVEGVFVFATVETIPAGISPRMVFQETEGTTLVLLREEAEATGLSFEFPCRMITLDVHSSLEAVGFIARISTELAKEGMGVNPVAGFYHDHLFVPEDRVEDAMRVLAHIAKTAS